MIAGRSTMPQLGPSAQTDSCSMRSRAVGATAALELDHGAADDVAAAAGLVALHELGDLLVVDRAHVGSLVVLVVAVRQTDGLVDDGQHAGRAGPAERRPDRVLHDDVVQLLAGR